MPAPTLYHAEGSRALLASSYPPRQEPRRIFYATDRAPALAVDTEQAAYSDHRGFALRVGTAQAHLVSPGNGTSRDAKLQLEITDVRELGVLEETILPFSNESAVRSAEPGQRLASAIDAKSAGPGSSDIFIYVHGYKVEFANPLLVAAELGRFLGHNGTMIAYSWPSTARRLAYFSDLEDAEVSARNLRKLIVFLAENTTAEKIHIIGYSAGTRLVARMLADFGMYTAFAEPADVRKHLRLGQVILVGSDIDHAVFAGYLMDGALAIPQALVVYQSSKDRALSLSKMVFGKRRVGQYVTDEDPTRERFLREHSRLQLVHVTNAPGALDSNGHAYFRKSPWVSSDLLLALAYGALPEQRGLQRVEGSLVWDFPADYEDRLEEALLALQQ